MKTVTVNNQKFDAQVVCTGQYHQVAFYKHGTQENVGMTGFGFYASKNKEKVDAQFDAFVTKHS